MYDLGYDDATSGYFPNHEYYNTYEEYQRGYEDGLNSFVAEEMREELVFSF